MDNNKKSFILIFPTTGMDINVMELRDTEVFPIMGLVYRGSIIEMSQEEAKGYINNIQDEVDRLMFNEKDESDDCGDFIYGWVYLAYLISTEMGISDCFKTFLSSLASAILDEKHDGWNDWGKLQGGIQHEGTYTWEQWLRGIEDETIELGIEILMK